MQKKKILIVEDDKDINALLRISFENVFDPICVFDGKKAIETINDDPTIAVILMDGDIPIVDGWQAATEIKKHHTIPIVCVSGDSIPNGFEHLFIAHFVKPYDFEALYRFVLKEIHA